MHILLPLDHVKASVKTKEKKPIRIAYVTLQNMTRGYHPNRRQVYQKAKIRKFFILAFCFAVVGPITKPTDTWTRATDRSDSTTRAAFWGAVHQLVPRGNRVVWV